MNPAEADKAAAALLSFPEKVDPGEAGGPATLGVISPPGSPAAEPMVPPCSPSAPSAPNSPPGHRVPGDGQTTEAADAARRLGGVALNQA